MENKKEKQIPCTTCKSYNAKLSKFSCKPNDCKELSDWLLPYVNQREPESLQMQVQLPDTAIPYVV
jgi:hypothetical protein